MLSKINGKTYNTEEATLLVAHDADLYWGKSCGYFIVEDSNIKPLSPKEALEWIKNYSQKVELFEMKKIDWKVLKELEYQARPYRGFIEIEKENEYWKICDTRIGNQDIATRTSRPLAKDIEMLFAKTGTLKGDLLKGLVLGMIDSVQKHEH